MRATLTVFSHTVCARFLYGQQKQPRDSHRSGLRLPTTACYSRWFSRSSQARYDL